MLRLRGWHRHATSLAIAVCTAAAAAAAGPTASPVATVATSASANAAGAAVDAFAAVAAVLRRPRQPARSLVAHQGDGRLGPLLDALAVRSLPCCAF